MCPVICIVWLQLRLGVYHAWVAHACAGDPYREHGWHMHVPVQLAVGLEGLIKPPKAPRLLDKPLICIVWGAAGCGYCMASIGVPCYESMGVCLVQLAGG